MKTNRLAILNYGTKMYVYIPLHSYISWNNTMQLIDLLRSWMDIYLLSHFHLWHEIKQFHLFSDLLFIGPVFKKNGELMKDSTFVETTNCLIQLCTWDVRLFYYSQIRHAMQREYRDNNISWHWMKHELCSFHRRWLWYCSIVWCH